MKRRLKIDLKKYDLWKIVIVGKFQYQNLMYLIMCCCLLFERFIY